jgi:hypothetical protein
VVGDHVLEIYESQLNYVSEKEACLKDEEIKKIKKEKDEEIKKIKEEKDEEIKKIKEEKEKEKDKEIGKRDETIKKKDEEIKKLKEENEKRQKSLPSSSSSSFTQQSSLITVNSSVINSEMEFIKPFDDVKIQERTITFTKDLTNRTVFINKIINSGIMRMFISFSL